MNGAAIGVIAAQPGHSNTRMTEQHYAHLSPSYISEAVRASAPVYGIVAETNFVAIEDKRK